MDSLERMPNKQFAFKCLQLLINNNKLDDKALHLLTNEDECQRLFQCSGKFTILNEIPLNCSDEELKVHCCDNTGRRRYYKEKIFISGRAFVVTNHWYGPEKSMSDNRTPFLRWVKSRI